MPSDEAFNERLDELPQLIEDIGDQVVGGLDESTDIGIGDDDTVGYWCEHGEHNYAVFTKPNREYFTILYMKSMMANIAGSLREEDIDELLDDYSKDEIERRINNLATAQLLEPKDLSENIFKNLDIDMEIEEFRELDEFPEEVKDYFLSGRSMIATIELIRSIDSVQMESMKDRLREQLSDPNVAFTLLLEGGAAHGFHVSKKIFVYENNFSLQVLSDSVQAVISIGVAGNNLLANAFGGVIPGGPEEARL